jgi:hypothetical protein
VLLKTVGSAQFLEVSEIGACGGRASDIECTVFSPLHSDQGEGHKDEELKLCNCILYMRG